MKINQLPLSGSPPLAESDGSSRATHDPRRFVSELSQTQEKLSRQRLDALLGEITNQGQRLSQTPTYSELKAYRTLVSRFLGEAVGQMYSVESQNGWDRQGRQKTYTTIKNIDKELIALTEDVRQGQERQLSIAARLDVIRGMLVDVYT